MFSFWDIYVYSKDIYFLIVKVSIDQTNMYQQNKHFLLNH